MAWSSHYNASFSILSSSAKTRNFFQNWRCFFFDHTDNFQKLSYIISIEWTLLQLQTELNEVKNQAAQSSTEAKRLVIILCGWISLFALVFTCVVLPLHSPLSPLYSVGFLNIHPQSWSWRPIESSSDVLHLTRCCVYSLLSVACWIKLVVDMYRWK